MIKLENITIVGLIGKMYVQLSLYEDASIEYINGYMDFIYHYESALKANLIFNPEKEVPVRRKLLALQIAHYDKTLTSRYKKDYDKGQVDANNFLFYHVQHCYLGK